MCPKGTYIDRTLLPLVLLILIDLLLVTLVYFGKIFSGKRKRKLTQSRRRSWTGGVQFLKRKLTFNQSPHFHSLPGDDIQLESRISGVRRMPTGFLATMDNEYAFEGDEDQFSKDEKSDPDIQQFVKSLSRCTLASHFGLSFEFGNLSFQPRKSSKPVLSEVSGHIRSGTLWGVMGASGAGKST